MWRFIIAICTLSTLSKSQSSERLNMLTNTLLQELMNRMANSETIDDLNESPYEMVNPIRVKSDYDIHPFLFQTRDDMNEQTGPSPRKDYFEPISLWGPQYIQKSVPETIQTQPPAKFLQKKNELNEVKRAKPQQKATSDILTAQLDNLKQQSKQNTDSNIGKEKI